MAEKRDYYDVLGVSKSSNKDEIKSAYRKLAKQYHPDNKETGNEAKFKEIQEAYDILYDDQKRSAYDQFGHAAFEQAGGNPGGNPFQGGFGGFGGDFGGFGDIFSQFFGGGQQRRRPSNTPTKGENFVRQITVDFMDAVLGKDLPLTINVDEMCPNCHGSGAKSQSDVVTCSQCRGMGFVKAQRRSLLGIIETEEQCPYCGGAGKIIKDKCPTCNGKGYNRVKKDITIHVIAGINNGQQIRVNGMGGRGTNGGPNGDLYLEVLVKQHQFFKRDGDDIHIDIPIDFVDACLGTTIDVPTVYGEVSLSIPAGTQPGQILKMKGQGVKNFRTLRPGDQYVHLQIRVPTSLNKEQKELLNKFKNSTSPTDSLFARFKRMFKR